MSKTAIVLVALPVVRSIVDAWSRWRERRHDRREALRHEQRIAKLREAAEGDQQ